MGIELISLCNQAIAEPKSIDLTGASPTWMVSHHELSRARSRRRRALSSMMIIGTYTSGALQRGVPETGRASRA
jgi:hypothetical protein